MVKYNKFASISVNTKTTPQLQQLLPPSPPEQSSDRASFQDRQTTCDPWRDTGSTSGRRTGTFRGPVPRKTCTVRFACPSLSRSNQSTSAPTGRRKSWSGNVPLQRFGCKPKRCGPSRGKFHRFDCGESIAPPCGPCGHSSYTRFSAQFCRKSSKYSIL